MKVLKVFPIKASVEERREALAAETMSPEQCMREQEENDLQLDDQIENEWKQRNQIESLWGSRREGARRRL